jgi:hypothetical protein
VIVRRDGTEMRAVASSLSPTPLDVQSVQTELDRLQRDRLGSWGWGSRPPLGSLGVRNARRVGQRWKKKAGRWRPRSEWCGGISC